MPEITYGRWNPSEVMDRVLDGTWPNDEDFAPGMGMSLLSPTSIVYSGTSASIGAGGSVEFSGVTSLSFNGVFSATYDNYMVVIRHSHSSTNTSIGMAMRASGFNEQSPALFYTYQELTATSSSVFGSRNVGSEGLMGRTSNEQKSGDAVYFYGPYLAQPTVLRSVNVSGSFGGYISDWATIHSRPFSYDGFSLIMFGGSLSGRISIYGLVGA